MNINARRVLAIILISAFIIGAPLLILYTSGYRYSFKKQKVSTAGSLVLETEPRGAFVEIEELDDNFTTPIRINNLQENTYNVKISKDGYFSWNKNLKVVSMLTTFAEDIILYKDEAPNQILEETILNPQSLPDQTGFTFLEQNAFYNYFNTYNFEQADYINYLRLAKSESIDKQLWSLDNNYLLIEIRDTKTDTLSHKVISRNSPENKIQLDKNFNNSPISIRWSNTQDNILYIKSQNTIFEGTINGPTFSLKELYKFPTSQKILDYIVHNENIYFLEDNNSFWLNKISTTSDKNENLQNKIELNSSTFVIKDIVTDKIILKDLLKNETYFINLDLDNILIKKKGLLGYEYNKKTNQLLTWNSSEISITNFNKYPFTDQILIRVSNGIRNAFWMDTANYIAYSLGEEIKIVELDDRDSKIIWTTQAQNVRNIFTDTTKENIYYTDNENSKLWKINLQ